MNLRKTTFLAVAFLALALTSCGTVRRAGKDLGVVALSPVIVPYGGFTDGFTSAQEVAEGLGGGGATQVLALPFTASYQVVKHFVWTVIHAVDFFAFPIYGAADLHPHGPEIEPLDYYTGTIFDDPNWGRSGTDPESGDSGN